MMTSLPTELTVLTLLMLLAASLWIPYIVGVNTYDRPGVDSFKRPPGDDDLPDWVARANRAHMNLLEQAMPFAVLTLILNATDGFTTLTTWTALTFLFLRLAHAFGMITGIARMPLRPLIFVTGWICVMITGVSVFLA